MSTFNNEYQYIFYQLCDGQSNLGGVDAVERRMDGRTLKTVFDLRKAIHSSKKGTLQAFGVGDLSLYESGTTLAESGTKEELRLSLAISDSRVQGATEEKPLLVVVSVSLATQLPASIANTTTTIQEDNVSRDEPLATRAKKVVQHQFFLDLFSNDIIDSPSGTKYLKLSNDTNPFETSIIVIRPCYEHMEPHIRKQLSIQNRGRIAITGTPGIGKSVYGILLTRKFVLDEESVVYWENDRVFLFSWDASFKQKYGLLEFALIGGKMLYGAFWENTGMVGFSTLMSDPRVIFIHDPKQGDRLVASSAFLIRRIVFVLSYGHDLIEYWATKNLAPYLRLYLPVWTLSEATKGAELLYFIEADKVLDLFYKFGGCIRGWRASQVEEMERTLLEKATEVVRKFGDDILGRTLDTRGSIVHMQVDFDESKPLLDFALSEQCDRSPTLFQDPEVEQACKPNDFRSYSFAFGSQRILEAIDTAITLAGDESLKQCLHAWATEPGYESIYGGLFELRCHRALARLGGTGKTLRARRVSRDNDDLSEVFNITLPGVNAIVRYKGNDPIRLSDSEFDGTFAVGSYFWPYSSNHPTYDAAMLVSGVTAGVAAGVSSMQVVSLLLQMTVSGASGLPRRPTHAIKQSVRKRFDKTFSDKLDEYHSAITTFVVPTECFEPFAFQRETLMDDDDTDAQNQPDYQLVVEMPDLFFISKEAKEYLALPEVTASHKRKHRYITRGHT